MSQWKITYLFFGPRGDQKPKESAITVPGHYLKYRLDLMQSMSKVYFIQSVELLSED